MVSKSTSSEKCIAVYCSSISANTVHADAKYNTSSSVKTSLTLFRGVGIAFLSSFFLFFGVTYCSRQRFTSG